MQSTDSAHGQALARAYWRANLKLMALLLAIWAIASFGAGIVFRDWLDQFSLGGAPLGFWMAQQGAIYVFLILIVVYCLAMTRLEKRYGIGASDTGDDDRG